MNMQELIEKCGDVASKWAQLEPTLETVKDFAALFDMEIGWSIRPMAPLGSVRYVGPAESAPPDDDVEKTSDDTQYELFNEMSVEDKYAMKSWRENNGL